MTLLSVSSGQLPLAREDWLHGGLQRLPRVSDHGYRDPLHFQVGRITTKHTYSPTGVWGGASNINQTTGCGENLCFQ